MAQVHGHLARNAYPPPRDFSIAYSGLPAAIARRVEVETAGTYFAEWAPEQAGTVAMEREAIRMMADLLGDGDAAGFITTGGTESNIAAMRIARNLGRRELPEIVAPATMHFSLRIGAELLGIRLRDVAVDPATQVPRAEDMERVITADTVALVCSAPEDMLGRMDPVEAIADLAVRKGLFLHVDAAFGGFILPFMRDLGMAVPRFDLSLPGVTSIATDGHKLGLLPVATGFFLLRDPSLFEAIPTDRTLIHTTSSTKRGSMAAAAWATFRHLGRAGYRASARHALDVTDVVARGLSSIPGMRLLAPPLITIAGFTSDTIDLGAVHQILADQGWGQGHGELSGRPYIRVSIHPSRTLEHAHDFVAAFRDAVRLVQPG